MSGIRERVARRVDPACIEQQRIAGWPDMHPEDFCHRCGYHTPLSLYADNETWLIAISAWAKETGREGICCPTCLVEMYEHATSKFTQRRFSPHVDSDMLAIDRERERDEARHELASVLTVVADVEDQVLEQVYKQLNKLINVIKVVDLAEEESVHRELALIKVKAAGSQRAEVVEIANIFSAKIVDIGRGTLTIELTGTGGKLEAFEDLLKPYGIAELVRTGVVALARG